MRFTLPWLIRSLFAAPSATPQPDEYRLAAILDLAVEDLPSVRLGRRYHYRPFTIPKRDGRQRRILAPSPALKTLQRRLLHGYLQDLPVHPAALAFRPGRSIVANAKRHAGQALIATLDLADFFETSRADRVRDFFLKQGWRGPALATLMRLCVYRDGLPPGAPTSPALSNLINVEMDEALQALARRGEAVYTRYGDDLTFSWPSEPLPGYFEAAVRREILAAGYQVQPLKDWRVYRAAHQPEITGLVLGRDGRVHAPRRILKQVSWLRWLAWWTDDPHIQARLQGYEDYLDAPELE